MTSKTPAKLPVWKTAAECYRLTFRHIGDLLRIAWPWLLLLIAVSGALYWSLYPLEQEAMAKTGSGSNIVWIATGLTSTAIGAFIAVPWHRLLLLGEPQDLSTALSFDRRRLNYFLRALALLALPVAPFMLAAFVLPEPAGETDTENLARDAAIGIAIMITLFCAIAVINRLSLVLPASALDHRNVGWTQSWRLTQKNTGRMLVISLMAMVPLFAFVIGAFSLYPVEYSISETGAVPSQFAFTISNIIMELSGMLTGMLGVTFLSLAYRHFTLPFAPERAPANTSATPPAA